MWLIALSTSESSHLKRCAAMLRRIARTTGRLRVGHGVESC